MNLPPKYNPKEVEKKIYKKWLPYLKIEKQRGDKNYIALMAPPNITGTLHMGHSLQNILLDVLLRYKKMNGYKIIWIPGIDHAGIATQNVVEKELKKEGKTRIDLGREKFIKRVWEWKEKYGNIILEQFKSLGIIPDWSRTKFTMDKKYVEWVENAFIKYYNEGWIYRDYRSINYCPRCKTSLSDLELEYLEKGGYLYYIKYQIKDENKELIVATTRPETIFGDTALCINPKDERYIEFLGKKAIVPIIEREILIISDKRVDPKYGTGVIKVTPAHDLIDYEIAKRHKLEMIQVINEENKIVNVNEDFNNLNYLEAREKVINILKEKGLIVKEEEIIHKVPHCSRCSSEIQIIPSKEWFLNMNYLSKLSKEALKKREVIFIPSRFKKIYFDWIKNIRDWCISRKIWWGQVMPVWYCKNCPDEYMVSKKMPGKKCKICKKKNWYRTDEVFDTWFSSALWPFAILYTKKEKEWYPADIVFTARDIINLWISRMIFSGIYFKNKPPFKFVYIHPTVLNKEGKRMSKSLGTGIDPLDLIEKYSADSLRFGLIWQNSGHQDLRFDETTIEIGFKFSNKVYNAVRFFILRYKEMKKKNNFSQDDKKIIKDFNKTLDYVSRNIKNFNFDKALKRFYQFFWRRFCDYYLETCKGNTKNNPEVLRVVLENSLKILHPFMPFLTEYLWGIIKKEDLLFLQKWPQRI
jgi:valyl-tRNA synthetase